MHILHNSTFQYIVHIDGKRKSLVHLLFKIHDFENISLSLWKWYFKKHHLFNKWNKQSMYILNYNTLLWVVHSIVGRNKLLSLMFFKIAISKTITLFLKKHIFLENHICLINRIKQVCNFIHNHIFLYIAHKIGKRNSLVPLIFKNHDF